MTATPPRAIGYVRVSTARDDMVSPELQRTVIEDHCARAGYVLAEVIEDLDLTARFWRRRQAERAVAMVEAGDADVIVMWKWSRLARNRRDWAVAVDRVEVAGGRLESATEPVDVTTSSGRLARGMLAEFAAFESDRIGDVWKEVHARRTKRGLPANGKPRWGYRVLDGMHRPDPDTGPVLAALYRRYVAGESVYSLVEWLNREGYRTTAGYSKAGPGPWTQMTLRRTLDSGFGAGLITVSGSRERGIHEPVIDDATWTAYRAARAARRTLRRSERSAYLLSGMVRCHHQLDDGRACGSPMGGGQFGHQRTPKYRCLAAAQERRHPGGYITMRVVEDAVLDWLRELAADVDVSADAAVVQQSRTARRRVDAKTLARELVDTDKALTRLAVQRAENTGMPASVWAAARDELLGKRTVLEERMLAAQAQALEGEPQRQAAQLLEDWDVLSVEQRRGTLRRLVARIEVTPGQPRGRVAVVPTWHG